jgi:hypothetical protein
VNAEVRCGRQRLIQLRVEKNLVVLVANGREFYRSGTRRRDIALMGRDLLITGAKVLAAVCWRA